MITLPEWLVGLAGITTFVLALAGWRSILESFIKDWSSAENWERTLVITILVLLAGAALIDLFVR
jgi:hypothetical protein